MPSSGIPSRSSSYGHSIRASPDGYGYSHIPTPEPTEPWAASIPVTVPSTVSSPSSSGPIEDYGYMPTSVPAPLMDGVPVAPTSAPYHNDVEYEDGVDSGKNDSITQPYNFTRPPVTTNCGSRPDTLYRSRFPQTGFKPRFVAPVLPDAPSPTPAMEQYVRCLLPTIAFAVRVSRSDI